MLVTWKLSTLQLIINGLVVSSLILIIVSWYSFKDKPILLE
jgi:hypothetical protein